VLQIDKRILNFLVIIFLSIGTIWWTFTIFHEPIMWEFVAFVIFCRLGASILIYKDYSLSWSKATQRTFLMKSIVYFAAFVVYLPLFYSKVQIALMASELFVYLFVINFLMYAYHYYVNRSKIPKTKTMVIYGAGKAGIKLEEEYRNTEYKIKYFVDDDKILQKRSIDSVKILSKNALQKIISKNDDQFDLLVIAMPSAPQRRIRVVYERLAPYFKTIKILPAMSEILKDKPFFHQLKDISIEDLLARRPKDLDRSVIRRFVENKIVLITGAGGSIGSEIARQCAKYGAKKLILLDHSEYNLYAIGEELASFDIAQVMQSVTNKEALEKTFLRYKPQIVIHAAAYKHVPLVEDNVDEAVINNVLGTKNTLDLAIKYGAMKFVLISTDKAVRPTNVMGATKRICELYALNKNNQNTTEIVAVRFGNVLGSSGSVIPKFRAQIEAGGPVTVTHPEITRYFMLIPEACELVLQAASIGKGGEMFILDMGSPVKIVDLAKKMIALSGRDDIAIEFTGLRPGEKLYEELLINDNDVRTEYSSILIAKDTNYDIKKLEKAIAELLETTDKVSKIKEIVPEFNHSVTSTQ